MAVVDITATKVPLNALSDAITLTAITNATDGATVTPVKDYKTLILLTNSAGSKTATIKGGNGEKGIGDVEVSLATADAIYGVIVDSAYFQQVSGTNKGKIHIVSPTTTSVAAVTLEP